MARVAPNPGARDFEEWLTGVIWPGAADAPRPFMEPDARLTRIAGVMHLLVSVIGQDEPEIIAEELRSLLWLMTDEVEQGVADWTAQDRHRRAKHQAALAKARA